MDIIQKITQELEVKSWQVEAAINLIDEGNTIPFISRYRKEVTGALNDEQLRKLHERLTYLRNLEAKKEQVLSSIEEQGKLTEELKAQILAAETLVVVEDLYRPYRPNVERERQLQKKRGWSLWQHSSCCKRRNFHSKKLPKNTFRKKKKWRQRRKPLKVQRTLLQNTFLTKQITGFTSVI